MSSTHDAASSETSNVTTIEDISSFSQMAYVPTAEEVALMRTLLSFPIAEFSLFGDLALVDPIAPDAPLAQIGGHHLAGASPVQRMPFDVMELIFLNCLPTGGNPMISEKEAPILLTHVCREWRDVAHSLPVLWSRIHFPVPTLPGQLAFSPRMLYDRYTRMFTETLEYRCAMAKAWMVRSAGVPLDITIHELDPQDHPRNALDMILNVLIAQSLRWKTLELFISVDSFERLSWRLSADDLPALESLSVINSGLCDAVLAKRVEWAALAILEAPKLRQVSFRDIPDTDFTAFGLNWSMLTKVSLEGRSWGLREDMTIDKIIAILRRCKALVECRFEIDNYKRPENAPLMPAHPIKLRNLKKLSLQNWGPPLVQFFELLDMPRLEYLQYHSKIQTEHEPADLLALLPRVSSTIETLVIHVTQYSLKDFIQCLRYCPNLKTLVNIPAYPEFSAMVLRIVVTDVANMPNDSPPVHWSDHDILNVLNTLQPDAVSHLVPKLQVFENFEPVGVTEDNLVFFISMRNGGSVPALIKLKQFTMVIRENQVKPILEDLELFIKDGLEVKICFAPGVIKAPIPAYYDVGSVGYPSVSVPGSPAF